MKSIPMPKKRFWLAYVDGEFCLARSSRLAAEESNYDLKEEGMVAWKVRDLTQSELADLMKPDSHESLWENAEDAP